MPYVCLAYVFPIDTLALRLLPVRCLSFHHSSHGQSQIQIAVNQTLHYDAKAAETFAALS